MRLRAFHRQIMIMEETLQYFFPPHLRILELWTSEILEKFQKKLSSY